MEFDQWLIRWKEECVGPVIPMIHHPSARPATHQGAIGEHDTRLLNMTEVSERRPASLPLIDPQRRHAGGFRQPLVHRHVFGTRAGFGIVPKMQFLQWEVPIHRHTGQPRQCPVRKGIGSGTCKGKAKNPSIRKHPENPHDRRHRGEQSFRWDFPEASYCHSGSFGETRRA